MTRRQMLLVYEYFFKEIAVPVVIYLVFIPVCIIILKGSMMLLPFFIATGVLVILSFATLISAVSKAKAQIVEENKEMIKTLKGNQI